MTRSVRHILAAPAALLTLMVTAASTPSVSWVSDAEYEATCHSDAVIPTEEWDRIRGGEWDQLYDKMILTKTEPTKSGATKARNVVLCKTIH
ncbi:hypothetical protein GCM10009530_37030 [Microbispora corallina]|uniref:Uncharacterized protein n=1 Tax=Microbispora corallina TaxID=83302 RepID=A0ABQ4G263_9ACTN|nr:hypothetical protein Mco01_41520 [Microbispora corallina]